VRCRACNSRNTRVITTDAKNATLTKRYCRCLDCKAHYQTVEKYAVPKPGPKLGSKTGTKVCGSAHPQSILTEADVIKMRYMHQKGIKQKELIKIFGVSSVTVSNICQRKAWTHV
jgi:hypothetical protein